MEGRFLGLPAVAVSLAAADHDGRHYETAARAAVEIIARLAVDPLPADTILNVNVPDLPWSEIAALTSRSSLVLSRASIWMAATNVLR